MSHNHKRRANLTLINTTLLVMMLGFPVLAFAVYINDLSTDALQHAELPTASVTHETAEKLMARGDYQKAVKYWRDQYKAYQAEQNLQGQLVSLHKIASAQRMMGQHDRAIRALEVANKLLTLSDDEDLRLVTQANLAGAYLYSGRLDDAKTLLSEARHLAIRTNNTKLLALIHNDLGNYYAFSGLPENAKRAYDTSIEISVRINNHLEVARAAANAMLLQIAQKSNPLAREYLLTAQQSLLKSPDSYQKSLMTTKLAESSLKLVSHPAIATQEALKQMVSVLDQERDFAELAGNDALSARINKVMADFYEATQQYDDALLLAQKAIFHAQIVRAADLLYQLEWQVGRIYRNTGRGEQAIAFYRRAVNTLQPIRYQLSKNTPVIHNSFMETQGNVYLELADLLLNKAAQSSTSNDVSALLLDARNTVEQEKTAELQDYFKDRCVVEAQSQVKSIDDTIGEGTAVIYPILLPDRTELLISYASGIKQYVVEQNEQAITGQIRQLRVQLEKRRSRDYLPYAKNLYNTLIAPLEEDFVQYNITTLVVVPGQALRTIPLSVLHDGKQFLVNKYALATTPGLTLTDPRPLKRQKMKVLLSGLSEPVQGFPPLDYVRGELEQINDLYISKLLLNKNFITNSISSELQDADYSVAHFASHAEFTGDVNDSYILTFDDRLTVNELGQYASLSQFRKKPIELLTLSACNTAAGDDRAALGLAGVAVKSGARSALASLWSINDKASSLLVTEFYRQLLDENVTKAVALKRAQELLMKNVRYRHPGYWSPFLLIGNWL